MKTAGGILKILVLDYLYTIRFITVIKITTVRIKRKKHKMVARIHKL